jgi:protein O-mannosyl-transferase
LPTKQKSRGRKSSSRPILSPAPTTGVSFAAWRTPRWPGSLLAGLLLVVITAATYSPVLQHPFINFDDGDYVVRNPHIQTGVTLELVRWALYATAQGNWHPVTWISHALDCQFFGLDPFGHHLMSLALHVANTLLLFSLLLTATRLTGRSFLVAALFAIHPLNVESVAWASQRKNVLSTLFLLLSIAAYLRYVQSPNGSRYALLLVAFFLALASKPMAVTLPFVLLLLDYWPLQRIKGWIPPEEKNRFAQAPFSHCVREKIPLLLLSAASCVVTLIAQRAEGSIKSSQDFSMGERLGNAAYSCVLYLWKAAYPAKLAVFYPHPGDLLSFWLIWLCFVVLLTLTWLVWRARHAAGYIVVGWLWFLGTLVPVIGIVQVGDQAMADRYAYFSLIGIFIAAVWATAEICEHWRIKTHWLVGAAIVVLITFSLVSRRQIGYWKDSYSLWSHALAVTADNPTAENQFGMALVDLNREDEAMAHFERAIDLGSRDPTSYLNVGAYLSEHGDQRQAIAVFETALRMGGDPESRALTSLDLGFAYASIGEYERARAWFEQAWKLDPDRVSATLGALTQFAGSHPSAKEYMKLGLLLEQAGKIYDAESAYEKVLQLDPGLAAAQTALATLEAK